MAWVSFEKVSPGPQERHRVAKACILVTSFGLPNKTMFGYVNMTTQSVVLVLCCMMVREAIAVNPARILGYSHAFTASYQLDIL